MNTLNTLKTQIESALEKIEKQNAVSREHIIELAPDPDNEYDDVPNKTKKSNANYGNFKILDPDGNLVGLCDIKRYRWYIRQNIATQISDKTIKLLKPPEYKNDSIIYPPVERDAVCVVCGVENDLTKFHVVPSQFKKHFPEKKKEHNSSDVILLCGKCSVIANNVTDIFKKIIFDMLEVSPRNFTDISKVNIRKFAMKIDKNKHHGKPYDVELKELKVLVGRENDTLTDQEIKDYRNISSDTSYKGFSTIGEYVTNVFKNNNKIDYFSTKWRDNFVQNMEPKYLPGDFFTNYDANNSNHNSDARNNDSNSSGAHNSN
jgi:hypothetical protein